MKKTATADSSNANGPQFLHQGRNQIMLDAFKTLRGGKTAQNQTEALDQLSATAREERSAISAMLTALTTRSAKLTPLSKSLEQMTDNAATVTTRLDEISRRLTTLDDRTKQLEEVDK